MKHKKAENKKNKSLNEILGGDEFLEDIESAIGVSLRLPKSQKKSTGSGLAAARKRKKTASQALRDRLSVSFFLFTVNVVKLLIFFKTKLFDKRTLKRVTQTIDQMQKARAEKNFSHQFNYALRNNRQ